MEAKLEKLKGGSLPLKAGELACAQPSFKLNLALSGEETVIRRQRTLPYRLLEHPAFALPCCLPHMVRHHHSTRATRLTPWTRHQA